MKTSPVYSMLLRFALAFGLALPLAGCGGGSSGSAEHHYSIAEIPPLSGDLVSRAVAINNVGHILAYSADIENPTGGEVPPPYPPTPPHLRPFLYSSSTAVDLSGIAGIPVVYSLNDLDHVLLMDDAKGGPYLYADGQVQDLSHLGFVVGGPAAELNDRDQIACSVPFGYTLQAGLVTTEGLARLGQLASGLYSSAEAVNALGQTVGYSQFSVNGVTVGHAVLFNGSEVTDLGLLAGDYSSQAVGINRNGLVIGNSMTESANSTDGSGIHAFLYSQGRMAALGTLLGDASSQAVSINDAGQIVGVSLPLIPFNGFDGGTIPHPFLYRNGKMVALSSLLPTNSGWTLQEVVGINNSGQICGTGQHNGHTRAFVMTPK